MIDLEKVLKRKATIFKLIIKKKKKRPLIDHYDPLDLAGVVVGWLGSRTEGPLLKIHIES